MRTFEGVGDAARAIQDFLFDREAALPDDVRAKLRDLVGPTVSPVDSVVNAAELLYARRSELSPQALELAAGLALIASQYNFHGLGEDERGSKMALGMMRDADIKAPTGVKYPAADKDPEPKPQFIPTPEPTETPEPPVIP